MPVSPGRLLALRAVYALIALAMGAMTWPAILFHTGHWEAMPGVVKCMLGGLTLLALIGIRYPLKMLPLLFWEMAWKTIWLLAVALPALLSGTLSPETETMAWEVIWVVIVYAAVPWPYVLDQFFRAPAEPWTR